VDRRLFFLLNMAQHRLYSHVDRACEEALGVSAAQLAALMYIGQSPGCAHTDVGCALQLKKPAVTGLLQRMERNGLIERRQSEQDARRSELYATSAGLAKSKEAKPYLQELNSIFTSEFEPEEIDTVLRFLNFIMQRF
jgi:DNA-binding MarR family transcriptional regulator